MVKLPDYWDIISVFRKNPKEFLLIAAVVYLPLVPATITALSVFKGNCESAIVYNRYYSERPQDIGQIVVITGFNGRAIGRVNYGEFYVPPICNYVAGKQKINRTMETLRQLVGRST